jgi:hypothetical protein
MPDKLCKKCNNPIIHKMSKHRKLCDNCKQVNINWRNLTLKDIKNRYGRVYANKIREWARRKNVLDKLDECQNCKYNKHTEVCHIKAISNFSDDTLISKINKEDNLFILCPNCHWEFDNGYLSYIDEKWIETKPKTKLSICRGCNGEFRKKYKDHIYCSIKCYPPKIKCLNRPSKEELEQLLKTRCWTDLGKQFGVTDNSVRKWAINYGITFPRKRKPRVAKLKTISG